MTTTDPEKLGPQDFDECFRGEPTPPEAAADLARGRRRRTRTLAAAAGAVTAVAAAAGLGLGLGGPSTQTAVPAATPSPQVQTSTPSPRVPVAGPPSGPVPSAAPDTAPALHYTKAKGYLDRNGRFLDGAGPGAPFSATTRHTYDLVRLYLDPDRGHLGTYEKDAFSGGGSASGVEVGQKLGWKVKGDPGEGMLLVAVTRPAPGKRVVTSGAGRDGLCAGTFVDTSCKRATVDGHQVFLDRQPGGGFVVDYVQPDGELASAWVDPLFGNNTDIPLTAMDVSLTAVLDLLTDPDLDVVG